MRPIYAFGGLALFVSLPLAARAQEVATVEVTPAHASVVAGGTAQFSATARDADGAVIRDIEVAWLATPFPIAGADENGLVTTMRPGQIYVIAFAGNASGVAILDVAERPVAEVAIEAPGGTETVEGGMLRLELLASTELGDPVSGVSASWRSLRPDIAEVGPGGIVTGSAPGLATIVTEAEGHSARTEVTVRANPVAAIELSAVSDP
ncbi:MAG: Ig-like domain-containing protein, partial [Gemmatimonadota bacterium]